MGTDVSVDSEPLLMTDFINLKIKQTQSFRSDNMGRTYVYIFIEVNANVCVYIYIFFKKIRVR
jgi:hypothetical protein